MARTSNLYRRGAVYWWRRRLNFAVPEKFPITLSLSLLTKTLSIARARGAAMTMVSERLRMTIQQQILSGELAPAQAKTIYQEAVRKMGSALLEMTGGLTLDATSDLPGSDRALIVVEQFWQSVSRVGMKASPGWTFADEHWPALDEDAKRDLMFSVRGLNAKQKFETDVIEALLKVGCQPTVTNQAVTAKLIADARATAARRATQPGWIAELMLAEEVVPPGGANLHVASAQGGGDARPSGADDEFACELESTQNPTPIDDQCVTVRSGERLPDIFRGVRPEDRRLLEMTPVGLANHFIKEKIGFFDHRSGRRAPRTKDEHTKRQIICAARLLQQSLPPRAPFSLVTADQVKAFDALLDHLPLSFGKAPNDHALDLQLKDVAAKTADRVALGDLAPDKVGLSIVTTNKHFRYLQRMRSEVERLCSTLPHVSYARYCQPDTKKDRDARVEYTPEQGRAIFGLSPWTGCRSLKDRLKPGTTLIHDALYWVLLLVWYTGARREETCALRSVDIRHEHGIDYILIPDGKTENAHRHIPIASELKRLGFLAFVAAMREAGEHMLFPEIQPGQGKRNLGDVFYKLWWIYLRPMVPGLIRGQAMHSCRHMVSTELKDLGVFPEWRNDLLGHGDGKGGEGVTRYPKATRLHRLQNLVDSIPVVTDHLPDFVGKSPILPAALRVPRPIRESAVRRER